jgi:iduronate 2-sulfatase
VYNLGTFFRDAKPDAITLGQWFQQHGWRTEAMGKLFYVGQGNQEDAASWSVRHCRPKGKQRRATNTPKSELPP